MFTARYELSLNFFFFFFTRFKYWCAAVSVAGKVAGLNVG